jgi:ABC-type sugar transport system ATPase subunit
MLKLNNISKKFGDFALTDINIHIPEGEYYVLLGRSGSGKTQLLEMIAGLNNPDSGEIWIDNKNVTKESIRQRKIGLMFQDFAIFPNMTVFGNIVYPLHCRKAGRREINHKAEQIAEELNISNLLDRFTQNLSSGELQRVALARTLITSPKLLLLDEPMASVDASLKDDIRKIFRKLNRKGLTMVHVTHDYREAVSLAKRVGVIHKGRIVQEGSPEEVFSKPANRFVARYAGIKNSFRVKFFNEHNTCKAKCDSNLVFNLSDGEYPEEGLLIIKNDSIKIHNNDPLKPNNYFLKGVVREILKSETGMEIMVDAGEIFYVNMANEDFEILQINELSEVWITFQPETFIVLKEKVSDI